mmetsp:Transcript_22737/g.49293  ORF Transcript_22737/g.49293 Transcript_22737/m.49293 type:complete len:220 (-) Transcript_22737:3987-4646(-)
MRILRRKTKRHPRKGAWLHPARPQREDVYRDHHRKHTPTAPAGRSGTGRFPDDSRGRFRRGATKASSGGARRCAGDIQCDGYDVCELCRPRGAETQECRGRDVCNCQSAGREGHRGVRSRRRLPRGHCGRDTGCGVRRNTHRLCRGEPCAVWGGGHDVWVVPSPYRGVAAQEARRLQGHRKHGHRRRPGSLLSAYRSARSVGGDQRYGVHRPAQLRTRP